MAEGAVPMSGQRHISVPKAFAGGDVCEWLTRFEIWASERVGRHEEGPHIADPTRGRGARCVARAE